MEEPSVVKRRRGGQPRNQNAKNNRGNSHPRRNFGNRGGKGAPIGNQFALKPFRSGFAILFEDYKDNSEARQWIEEHRSELDILNLADDKRIERGLRDGHLGFTPEELAAKGAELRLGLARLPDEVFAA